MQLSGPLLSLTATGKIGNDLVIQQRGNHWSGNLPYSRDDVGSDAQILFRNNFDRALTFWRNPQMSTEQKQAWLYLCARYALPMSGYNVFMRWALFSLRDSTHPAASIFSENYYGGAYAWQIMDLRTGGACADEDVFQVWAWQNRAARTLIKQTPPTAQGRIVLTASERPPPGSYVSISVELNHRSGISKLYAPPPSDWQSLKDLEITWGELKDGGTTWGDLKGT